MKCSWISYGRHSIQSPARWPVFIMMMRWLTSWHRKRTLARTQIQLQALRQSALSAHDDFRDHLIISVNALLSDLQVRGIITLVERRNLAREWVKDYVRSRLPALYRERNVQAVDRLGCFLKTS
jgi:hypothetical protein